MRLLLLAAILCMFGTAAHAQQANEIPLPRDRPEVAAPETPPAFPLPRPRPEPQTPEQSSSERNPFLDGWTTAIRNPPPEPEFEPEPPAPPRIYQVACPAVFRGEAVARALPPISEGQCGLQSPLSLEAVMANGRQVPLSSPAIVDCGMATALPGWVAELDRWLEAVEDTRIAEITSGTAYMCRNVNNARAGNLSFHAFGDALDITGFQLEDGRRIDVQTGWPGSIEQGSRIVRFAHSSACAHFTTVLGPEANALHRDHLHLDLGCHGQSCTARLCE